MFRVVHNLADLVLFLLVGGSGIVAEVFPRDSATHRILKTNFPFFNSLVGRGFFYVVFGMIVMGNYGGGRVGGDGGGPSCNFLFEPLLSDIDDEDSGDSPVNFWGYFCVVSGLYVVVTGCVLVYNSMKNQRNLPVSGGAELIQPMVAFIPSVATHVATIERRPIPLMATPPTSPSRDDNFPIAV